MHGVLSHIAHIPVPVEFVKLPFVSEAIAVKQKTGEGKQ